MEHWRTLSGIARNPLDWTNSELTTFFSVQRRRTGCYSHAAQGLCTALDWLCTLVSFMTGSTLGAFGQIPRTSGLGSRRGNQLEPPNEALSILVRTGNRTLADHQKLPIGLWDFR